MANAGLCETLFLMKCQTASIKNLVICSLHFTLRTFRSHKQDTIRCRIFRKIETKDDAVPTILDLTVMSQHLNVNNCFYYMVTVAFSVITDCLICIELFMHF